MGIKVLPPDVNESIGFFAAVGDDIRFGLGAVRNVGFNVVDAIRAARESKGRFESFHDFLKKSPIQVANKRTVESLVKAGAFDSLGHTRRALVEIHESAVESVVKEKRAEEVGDVLVRHRGDTEVRLKLVKGRTARVFELPHQVQVTADLYGELKSLLGPNCLV